MQKLSATALSTFLKTQLRHHKHQIEFGLGKPGRDSILKDIHQHNKKLERLLGRCDKLAKFKRADTITVSPRAVKSLLQYWQHADRIYALMHHSWGCTCKQSHCAYIWLQHKTSPSFEFKLLVLWAPFLGPTQALPPWDRQALRITREDVEVSIAAPSVTKAPPLAMAPPASTTGAAQSGAKKRRTMFGDVQ